MPLRSTATARQERLGAELRKMREAAGITARDTARLLGTDPAKVSHIEAGRLGVSEERLRRLAAFYECGDTALIDALVSMANGHGRKGWWEAYRGVVPAGLLDISEMEHYAVHLRPLQVSHIPGLLQTEAYTRTVFGYAIPPLPDNELEARVAHRMERANLLHREAPPPYEALVHEAALRMRFGGAKVAKAQLDYIQELSHLPRISVRVIPFASEGYIGSSHAMLYAGGTVPQLDTVQIDSAHGVLLLHAATHLANYLTRFETLTAVALDRNRSRDFIHGISREL
ncbi:Helix-turn-helix domain-containing protein [Actinacidiphila yanglinensis]|uniref:Helix-turn-helix domain-containing protein n=1 Tax=Actinacidiphila yanglinensis TaxID=310779 RepID=A0A1H5SJ34_9ACTN|nr:helix-turn-helix transcriptional regulator [Actinacidiphila yanglinensis]SEF50505.1 Helix-turn-helix domain-containing protein [Actinacidiphila yanglinensis]